MLLRYGRTIDNRRYKRAGFKYQYTTRARSRRSRRGCGSRAPSATRIPSYSYERDVENFFRHSSAVVRPEQRLRSRWNTYVWMRPTESRSSRSSTGNAATR